LVLNEIPSHSHTYPVNGQGSGAQYGPNATTSQTGNPKTNTDNAGGGLAHNNMQPSMAVNYIIKYRSTSDLINKVQAPAQVKTYVIGDAVSSSFTINHGFNTDKLLVRMEYYATKQNYPSINYTIVDNNNISIEFDIVPTQDEFQITLVILQSEIQLNSFDQTFGDGSTTTFTFTHNLNVRYPDVKVIRLSDNEYIYPRVIYTNTTSLQVIFATAPAMNTYKVFIQSGISKVNDADTLCGKAISELMDMIYPVGSIYMSVSNTNPGTLFGGTWAAWGAGKVPVGIDTAQSEFNTIEETGGEKTHVLTGAESGEKGHRHSYINVPSSDGHRFRWTGSGGYSPGYSGASAVITNTVTGEEIYTSTIAASNASSAHNNLQPYIVCYMWKRTA
jgi:microcystin-dependent protein